MDPFQISVPELAEFFLFLFHEKGLNPRTIKGYRSAISSTISSCRSRSEITNSAEISSLIRSFQLERFEPIHSIELKFLTLKTVFLVALASGRRRSEIHRRVMIHTISGRIKTRVSSWLRASHWRRSRNQ